MINAPGRYHVGQKLTEELLSCSSTSSSGPQRPGRLLQFAGGAQASDLFRDTDQPAHALDRTGQRCQRVAFAEHQRAAACCAGRQAARGYLGDLERGDGAARRYVDRLLGGDQLGRAPLHQRRRRAWRRGRSPPLQQPRRRKWRRCSRRSGPRPAGRRATSATRVSTRSALGLLRSVTANQPAIRKPANDCQRCCRYATVSVRFRCPATGDRP